MTPNSKTRIMVFGTFDVLHKGHLHFFKQARALAKNPYLIVSVARDKNVKRIKGSAPSISEHRRLLAVKKNTLADKVVLGGQDDHLPHIIREHPDVIALGFDQKNYVKNLQRDLTSRGLKVSIKRLKPYKRNIYRSSLIKKSSIL